MIIMTYFHKLHFINVSFSRPIVTKKTLLGNSKPELFIVNRVSIRVKYICNIYPAQLFMNRAERIESSVWLYTGVP